MTCLFSVLLLVALWLCLFENGRDDVTHLSLTLACVLRLEKAKCKLSGNKP